MPVASSETQRLAKIFKQLSQRDRETLFAFADFLLARGSAPVQRDNKPISPGASERPEGESVIAAIKRLRVQYPMVDPDKLLHETSALMQSHMLKGRAAEAVIDELEALFVEKYEIYLGEFKGASD